jgi:hypothetical protein
VYSSYPLSSCVDLMDMLYVLSNEEGWKPIGKNLVEKKIVFVHGVKKEICTNLTVRLTFIGID